MKNILSSLNESEKKRILEMHYRASNRQYLTEKTATQKTTTSTQTYKQKIDAKVDQLYSDYFSFGFMEGSSEKDGAIFQIYPKSNNTYFFEKVGDPNISALYYCKSGWGTSTGANPFESNITLTYKPVNSSTNKGEKGLKVSDAAQKLVNDACSKIGQSITQKTTTTPTKTTPSNEPKKLTAPSGQADNDVGYWLFQTDLDFDRSKEGDEVVTVSTVCNGPDKTTNKDFLMKAGENEYSINCRTAKYSCKFKKWSTSSEPTVPSSRWVSDGGGFGRMAVALPKAKQNFYGYEDLGKTPDEIANKHAEYFCTNLKWQ